jgi:hypothetical protein
MSFMWLHQVQLNLTDNFKKFRQNVADSRMWDDEKFSEVMGKPQG